MSALSPRPGASTTGVAVTALRWIALGFAAAAVSAFTLGLAIVLLVDSLFLEEPSSGEAYTVVGVAACLAGVVVAFAVAPLRRLLAALPADLLPAASLFAVFLLVVMAPSVVDVVVDPGQLVRPPS